VLGTVATLRLHAPASATIIRSRGRIRHGTAVPSPHSPLPLQAGLVGLTARRRRAGN
jgi:hypothetical protein